jgi:hypothetical protein
MWLTICLDEDTGRNSSHVMLFYWPDLLQEAVGLDHVAKRSMNTEFYIFGIVGGINKTTMIIGEGNSIIVRKFWP